MTLIPSPNINELGSKWGMIYVGLEDDQPNLSGPFRLLGINGQNCFPWLDQTAGDFKGAHGGKTICELFISDIGGLFPIALWGRTLGCLAMRLPGSH